MTVEWFVELIYARDPIYVSVKSLNSNLDF